MAKILGILQTDMLGFAMVLQIFLLLTFSSTVLAQNQQFTIRASKASHPLEAETSSVQIITREEIQESPYETVAETLQAQTGIYLNQAGPLGGVRSLRTRGLNGAFTKIIVDGNELKDVSSIDGSYQLQFLSLEQVDSIEILKGGQSPLYGTDSSAGVIKINLRKDKSSEIKIGGGSYGTSTAQVYHGNAKEKIQYSARFSFLHSDGISKINKDRFPNAEKDFYQNYQFSPQLTYNINSKSKVSLNAFFIFSDQEIDNYNSDRKEADLSTFDQQSLGLVYKTRLLSDLWETKINLSETRIDRFTEVQTTSFFESLYRKIDWQNSFFINENYNLLIGGDYEYLEANIHNEFQEKSIENDALYFVNNFYLNKNTLSFKARNQNAQNFDSFFSYSAGIKIYLSPSLDFKLNTGKSFQAPTLYQIYSQYGTPTLRPSVGKSHDTSLVITPSNQLSFEITYFLNEFEQFIDFDLSSYKYLNIQNVRTYGWEGKSFYQFSKNHKINIFYTYTYAHSGSGELPQVPRKKLVIQLNSKLAHRISLATSLRYIDSRLNSPSGPTLPSYTVIDLGLKKSFKKSQLGLSIYNILNKKYEEVYLYGVRGLSFHAYAKFLF